MSKANDNSRASTDTQITCETDVVLTVYGPVASAYENERDFVSDVFGADDRIEIDLYEETTETSESVELKIDFDEIIDRGFGDEDIEIEHSFAPYKTSEKEALRKRFGDVEDLPEYLTFVNETTEETCYVHNAIDPVETIVEDIVPTEALEACGFEATEYTVYPISYERQVANNAVDADPGATITQNCRVNVGSSSTIKPRRVLLHNDEREQGNLYASGPERWSFQVTVHLEASSGEELSEMADSIVPETRNELIGLAQIDGVRLEKCEKQVEQEGACYNL